MNQKDKYKNLPVEKKNRLFKWFKSQQEWHLAQPKSKWHTQQAQWYKRNSRWLFTFTEIVSMSFRNHAAAIAENVQRNNSLLARLTDMQNKSASSPCQ